MSAPTATLRIGTVIHHDGAVWTVAEFSGRRLLLRRRDGQELRQVDVAWLLSHATTHISADESGAQDPGGSSGARFGTLDAARTEALRAEVEHLREMTTGYRLGHESLAMPGEPRPQFAPGVSRMDRYREKAAELGVGVSTLRRRAAALDEFGPQGLLPAHTGWAAGAWGEADPRWVDACQQVLARHVNGSRPTRALVLAQIAALLAEQYGEGVVRCPASSTGYRLLARMTKGTNAFTGSTKAKRSIASRPAGVYGRLRATRPGEFVLLDTNRLDVYAMETLTCRWVQAELSIAMDLYSRAIVGLRLTPVSTKAVDVAAVLYETLRPHSQAGSALPAAGVAGIVVVPADRLCDHAGRPLLPSVAAETVVFDHGQIYLSDHLNSVCARFGISLQPARPRTPTDKSPLERWFRSLNDGLLVALPGYKGADVHSRGLDVENEAFFFLDELETIIRQWVHLYHQRPHDGLCVPEIPGLELSPLEMFEHGINRAGYLTILDHPDLAYEFLQVRWVKTIQHYGIQLGGMRYHAPVLAKYKNTASPYTGVHGGQWPISVDPGDVTRVFFRDPDDGRWHTCWWEHAPALGQPMSAEAIAYARKLATTQHRFPDTQRALTELLQRWGAGLTANAAERRMALRMSQQGLRLLDATPDPYASAAPAMTAAPHPEPGADTTRDETAATPNTGGAGTGPADLAGFYADVMDSE